MKLTKSLLASAAVLAGGLVATGANAAEASFACTSVPATDTAGINQCVLDAGPDGTCTLSGACETSALIILDTPNLTLQGPASLRRGAGGSAIALRAGASGTTIQNLEITSVVGVGVTNTAGPMGGVFHQPDDVTIRNNKITAVLGVQQWHDNGPPFNDFDRRNGLPAGIVTGWVIEGNTITSTGLTQNGMLLTGAANTVVNNEIFAPRTGITFQNNVAVALGGSVPTAFDNFVSHNVIHVGTGARAAGNPRGIALNGYFGPAAGEFVPGARPDGNVFQHNCLEVQDSLHLALAIGIGEQDTDNNLFENNNVTLGDGLAIAGKDDRFTNTSDVRGTTYRHNDIAGSQADGILIFNANSARNTVQNNKIGGPVDPLYVAFIGYNEGVDAMGPNQFLNNKWCSGGLFYFPAAAQNGIVAAGNKAGLYCSHGPGELSPAHDCNQGLGFAGVKSLEDETLGLPVRRVDPASRTLVDVRDSFTSPVLERSMSDASPAAGSLDWQLQGDGSRRTR